MINIFENNNAGNSTSADFLHSMSGITFILSLIPLVIFVWLAIRSKSIKAFQFQISIFIAVYILGEIIETSRIAIFSTLPPDIGSQIHVGSAIFFTIMVWFRFYYAEKSRKNMVESSINNDNSSGSRRRRSSSSSTN
jgi:D-alanyl-lipoteichoic acid acyltransferase DltB (MBOAT superfamily)